MEEHTKSQDEIDYPHDEESSEKDEIDNPHDEMAMENSNTEDSFLMISPDGNKRNGRFRSEKPEGTEELSNPSTFDEEKESFSQNLSKFEDFDVPLNSPDVEINSNSSIQEEFDARFQELEADYLEQEAIEQEFVFKQEDLTQNVEFEMENVEVFAFEEEIIEENMNLEKSDEDCESKKDENIINYQIEENHPNISIIEQDLDDFSEIRADFGENFTRKQEIEENSTRKQEIEEDDDEFLDTKEKLNDEFFEIKENLNEISRLINCDISQHSPKASEHSTPNFTNVDILSDSLSDDFDEKNEFWNSTPASPVQFPKPLKPLEFTLQEKEVSFENIKKTLRDLKQQIRKMNLDMKNLQIEAEIILNNPTNHKPVSRNSSNLSIQLSRTNEDEEDSKNETIQLEQNDTSFHFSTPMQIRALSSLLMEKDEGEGWFSLLKGNFGLICVLNSWIIDKIGMKNWKLKYQASKHGFSVKKFHEKCDNLEGFGNVSIIVSENGSIFGAFTTKQWKSEYPQYVEDKNAFVFSLFNSQEPERPPQKFNVKKPNFAIWCSKDSGISFGFMNGIKIFDNSNINANSTSNLSFGGAYDLGRRKYYSNREGKEFMCGSFHFSTKEIILYTLN